MMGTRCTVGMMRKCHIESIFCAMDGYVLGGVGERLYRYYNTESSVEDLLAHGDVSNIGIPDSVTPSRTEPVRETRSIDRAQRLVTYSRDEREFLSRFGDVEYAYLFDCETFHWYLYRLVIHEKCALKYLLPDVLRVLRSELNQSNQTRSDIFADDFSQMHGEYGGDDAILSEYGNVMAVVYAPAGKEYHPTRAGDHEFRRLPSYYPFPEGAIRVASMKPSLAELYNSFIAMKEAYHAQKALLEKAAEHRPGGYKGLRYKYKLQIQNSDREIEITVPVEHTATMDQAERLSLIRLMGELGEMVALRASYTGTEFR